MLGASTQTRFIGLELANPTILASGIMGVTKASVKRAIAGGCGAATIKTITLEPRQGHPNPTVVESGDAMLNAVGYSNMGVEAARQEFFRVNDLDAPVIASITAENPEVFGILAEKMMGLGFDAIEAVLSCPHTPGLGLLAGLGTPEATRDVTRRVKKNSLIPVIIKLSPDTPQLVEVAIAAEKAGADAVNMGNTHGPGMVIDVKARKPVLGHGHGGLSGPAVRPITVRCVYDLYENLRIPIIGTGGVTLGIDAVEMMMAGAATVGVGTAVYYDGVQVFEKITDQLREFMLENAYMSVGELVGVAHRA